MDREGLQRGNWRRAWGKAMHEGGVPLPWEWFEKAPLNRACQHDGRDEDRQFGNGVPDWAIDISLMVGVDYLDRVQARMAGLHQKNQEAHKAKEQARQEHASSLYGQHVVFPTSHTATAIIGRPGLAYRSETRGSSCPVIGRIILGR